MPRLVLAAMLMPATAAALCGPGVVARCMSPLGLEATLASFQSVAVAAVLFAMPISWAMAAVLIGGARS